MWDRETNVLDRSGSYRLALARDLDEVKTARMYSDDIGAPRGSSEVLADGDVGPCRHADPDADDGCIGFVVITNRHRRIGL